MLLSNYRSLVAAEICFLKDDRLSLILMLDEKKVKLSFEVKEDEKEDESFKGSVESSPFSDE